LSARSWRASTAPPESHSFAGTYFLNTRGAQELKLTQRQHSFDSIGCIDLAKDFIVAGTASDQLFGTCEGLWEPDLEPEDLFETISQALLNAVDRDALSGWGAHVYIIEKDKVTKRLLKGRQD
jgi:20S proteasome alpha/beta subunit